MDTINTNTTMLVALIGALSAFFGTLVGGLLSNHAISKQLKAEDARLRHKEKADAYCAFLNAYQNFLNTAHKGWVQSPTEITVDEMDESGRFSAAYASASLFAPKAIRMQLEELYTLAAKCAGGQAIPDLAKKYSELQDAMYNDLLTS